MSPKEIAKRWFHEVWNRKNAQAIHEMMEPDGRGNTEGGVVVGPAQFEQQMYRPLLAAFPDIQVTIDGALEEGDEVALRWTVSGTHQGELLGVPATGRKASFSGMTWLRFTNGKLAEGWDRWNVHGLMALLSNGVESPTARWAE